MLPVGAMLVGGLAAAGTVLRAAHEAVPLNPFDLPPGASLTLTFEVTVDNPLNSCATAISNQGSITGSNFTTFLTDDPAVAGTSNPTVVGLDVVDLSVTKTDGATTAVPGAPVTYTIQVSNSGPATATNANLADSFPGSLSACSWTSAASPGASGNSPGPVLGNIAQPNLNLSPGASITYTATCSVSPLATGSLANTATVTKNANQTECNFFNNSATDTDTLTPQVDLSITKTDFQTSVNAGSPTSYTIVVSNSGPSAAVGAAVNDTFPASLLSPTSTCSASFGSSCAAGPVAGNLADLPTLLPGGTATYTVNATVSGSASGTLSNTATVMATGGTTDGNPANNSATDTTTVNPVADLSITKTDGTANAVPGMSVTYTIVASNAGPATATAASVADTFPAACASISWTCVGAGGGTCTAGPISGNIADSVNLPAGAAASYSAVCTLSNAASGSLSNTATISGGGVSDTNPSNNSATDTDTVLTLDFGDAPNGALAPPSGYPTLLADNGARHGITALRLGALIDNEANGQPTVGADGDDLTALDDEDGVSVPPLVACETANFSVTVAGAPNAKLDAWIDYNADGDFADAGEKVVDNLAVLSGSNNVPVIVPCGAAPVAKTFVRFRLSSAGGLLPTGVAADGEVEDYTTSIIGVDFGDAPDPLYPTLFASNGARHLVTAGGPILGTLRDADANASPNPGATGDDLTGIDDEDGVLFTSALIPGQSANVAVTASAPGQLSAWIDFDADGNFTTPGDAIFVDQIVAAGVNNLVFAVPASANSNSTLISRFRISTAGGLSFTGLAADGEVEDHAIATVAVADLAITKTDLATDEVPGTPVTYTIVASNAGPDMVSGVTVTDTFPAPLTGCNWTSLSAGGATGNSAGPVAGNIAQPGLGFPAGSSITYTATCNISPLATGTLVNTATIAAGVGVFDPNATNNSATDSDTLTPSTDLSVTKTDGSATEIPGTPVSYTIVISNAGPSTATGATLSDNFPGALAGCNWSSVAAGGASGNSPGPVAGNIGQSGLILPPTSSVTYTATCNIDPAARGTLANTATVGSATADPVNGNNSATDSDTLTPQVDLAVAKVESIDPVIAGSGAGNLTYTITLSNAGPSTATAVTLSEAMTLPAGVTLLSVTPSQGTFAAPTWSAGTLAPSSSATLTVVLTAAGNATTAADSVCDTASVTGAAEPLVNTGNDSDSECTSVTRRVDIAVSKTESIDPVVAGSGVGNLTYVVTLANNGPSDASGLALTEALSLPAGVTIASATPSQGTYAAPNWTAGVLVSGTSATLTVVVTASAAAAPGTDVICDTATLSTVNETQIGIGNESDSECTSITVSADLEITKIDDADPPPAGSNLTYTLTVTNHGPSNAVGVSVTDPLPAAVTYVSDTCSGTNTPPWKWTIGNLANGATVACNVVVSINPTPPASISNTATVAATTNDAVPGNNSDTENTTLDAVPPTVTNVDSVAGTGDGSLAECEETSATISTLRITFDEAMKNPAGDSGADDVTNPANYLVVTPGGDFNFQTDGCGGAAGDDLAQAITGVSYDGGTNTATITLAASLPAAQIRLFACDSLTDAAGNELDGDADTNAGGDFRRAFRSDPGNVFANGHFDCDASEWNVIAANPNEITWTASVDAEDANDSGSAHFTNLAPGVDTSFRLWQCYDIPSAALFDTSVRVRLDASPGIFVGFTRRCEFFSASGCTGSLSVQTAAFALSDSGGSPLTIAGTLTRPAAAIAARCDFKFESPTAATFDAFLDDARFLGSGLLFANGFESGNTSAWSATVP
ncbi:MAG: GEVED domain-containing protein [Thermoanaerobaculia bacterium]